MTHNIELRDGTCVVLGTSTTLHADTFPIYLVEGTDGTNANLHPLAGDVTAVMRLLKCPWGTYRLADLDGKHNPQDVKAINEVDETAYKPLLKVALWLQNYLTREMRPTGLYSDGVLYESARKAQAGYLDVSSAEKFTQSLIDVLEALHAETIETYSTAKETLEKVIARVHNVLNQPYKATVAFHNTDYSKHSDVGAGYYFTDGFPAVLVGDILEVVSGNEVMYGRIVGIDRNKSMVRVRSAHGGYGTLIKVDALHNPWVLTNNDMTYTVDSVRVVPARNEKVAKSWLETCEHVKAPTRAVEEVFKQYAGQSSDENGLATPKSLQAPVKELYFTPNPWEEGQFLVNVEDGLIDDGVEYWDWKARHLLSEEGCIGARVLEALTQIQGVTECLKKLHLEN